MRSLKHICTLWGTRVPACAPLPVLQAAVALFLQMPSLHHGPVVFPPLSGHFCLMRDGLFFLDYFCCAQRLELECKDDVWSRMSMKSQWTPGRRHTPEAGLYLTWTAAPLFTVSDLCVDHSEHPPFRLPQREGLSIYLVAESQLCLCLSPLYRDLKPLEPFSLSQNTESLREPSKLWLPKPERTTLVKSTISRPLCLELRPTSFSGEAHLTLDTGNGRLDAFRLLTCTFSSFSLRTRVYWHAFIAVTGFHFFFIMDILRVILF